jgi:prevent-host-death family protein
MREIQLKEVKATLSAVVDKAIEGDPTIITRHGRRAAVVLSFEDFERLSNVPSFGELLTLFPGDAGDIPDRRRGEAREADL